MTPQEQIERIERERDRIWAWRKGHQDRNNCFDMVTYKLSDIVGKIDIEIRLLRKQLEEAV